MQGSAISYASLTARGLVPNRWDIIAFPLVFGLLLLAAKGAHETLAPLSALKEPVVSLDPVNLPEYALRTTLRMLAAMVASLLFTVTYGSLAAKSRRAELVLVPLLDILQSVPVLGYISLPSSSSCPCFRAGLLAPKPRRFSRSSRAKPGT